MPILGNAAVVMWWTVADEYRTEFHEWHSKEHLPERLGIPGFHRGSRWQREGNGDFFVMYELESYDTLTSDAYLARLNNPTSWSTKMMPRHSGMIRSQSRIVASSGCGIATYMATIRLSPMPGQDNALETFLKTSLIASLEQVGIVGAHLVRTDTPQSSETAEQRIRGGDAVADWVVLLSGHSRAALEDVRATSLSPAVLISNGAQSEQRSDIFRLVHAVTPQDV
ncbi:hypothetical protein [Rhizobium sp. SSA_523]|uniref:hypothetical protein n=1 Tax=Rhizobium sp. SSA_523 TaxID=2952477 RepID=UPI002091CF30|nr:hypothetical protein [Rhizobium sp. SSA_523]MCO5731557.1 hypothetical protein [Rhizobium sp. SSA_523]WKC21928.1 hypothetical protein QTJ18_01910 [Rhizobium sp. SSA_523]